MHVQTKNSLCVDEDNTYCGATPVDHTTIPQGSTVPSSSLT